MMCIWISKYVLISLLQIDDTAIVCSPIGIYARARSDFYGACIIIIIIFLRISCRQIYPWRYGQTAQYIRTHMRRDFTYILSRYFFLLPNYFRPHFVHVIRNKRACTIFKNARNWFEYCSVQSLVAGDR